MRDWFTEILGAEHDAAELMHRCQRIEVDAGETIVRAGDAADSMHFILDGRVGIMIPADHGPHHAGAKPRPLHHDRRDGPGLARAAQRHHPGRSREHALCFERRHQFEAIKTENPPLGQKLLTYFVSVMAERLTFANRMITVLRR